MQEHTGFFTGLYRALILPDKAFSEDSLFSSSRFPVFLLLLVMVFVGSAFALRFHQNETMRVLVTAETTRRMSSMMANAPEEARDQMLERAAGNQGGLTAASIVGLVLGTAAWLLFFLEIWLLSIVLMQFLGGEESPVGEKKHRRSQYLSLYCLIPLGLQELTRGIVYSLKDSATIGNVLTLEEYNAATRVSFSVLHLLGIGDAGGFLGFLLSHATNPFFLWTAVVALLGGRGVFRVGVGKTAIALAVVLAIVGLQNQVPAAVQGLFGG